MAAKYCVCAVCGRRFDRNSVQAVRHGTRRYSHAECEPDNTDFVPMELPKRTIKKPSEEKERIKTQEEIDKEDLEDYIKSLFEISSITPRIKRQIEIFHREKGYTYTGMKKTLKYFFEIRNNDLEKANGGIGIIPYVYNEAATYWRGIWEVQQMNKDIKVEKFNLPVREVHIEPPKREPMKHLRQLFTFLEREEDV